MASLSEELDFLYYTNGIRTSERVRPLDLQRFHPASKEHGLSSDLSCPCSKMPKHSPQPNPLAVIEIFREENVCTSETETETETEHSQSGWV